MRFPAFFCFFAFAAPSLAFATTAPSLANRISIDGRVHDYAADEWVLDSTSDPTELAGDSRWGSDNDIHRVALTWDDNYLYLAVEARNSSSSLISFVQYGAGGLSGLDILGDLRRKIVFDTFAPNIVALARLGEPPSVVVVDAGHNLRAIGEKTAPRFFTRFSDRPGAFEMAIPWSLMEPRSAVLSLLFAITGEAGTGAGDAAPDPTRTLEVPRFEQARLDRVLLISVDGDGDGNPDMGVSPRAVAALDTILSDGPATRVSLGIVPDNRTFAPDNGESISFSVLSGTTETAPVFLTCRVFSISGKLVRVLYENDERIPGAKDSRDVWDGRDRRGNIVAGGVYILHLSWAAARGSTDGNDKAAVAVVR